MSLTCLFACAAGAVMVGWPGAAQDRLSADALVIQPGCTGPRKGFTEADYAHLLDTAHQQLTGPVVVVWDNLNSCVSAAMDELIAARDWLTGCQLPPHT